MRTVEVCCLGLLYRGRESVPFFLLGYSLSLFSVDLGLCRFQKTANETIEVIRDQWGIPHVFADTSEGAFFGLGYATAEVRMFHVEYSRSIVRGRISEIIGQKGLENDKPRILGWYRVAEQVAQNLDRSSQCRYWGKRLWQDILVSINYHSRTAKL
jgi:acyl-homoserine lactone acylase PvdQ